MLTEHFSFLKKIRVFQGGGLFSIGSFTMFRSLIYFCACSIETPERPPKCFRSTPCSIFAGQYMYYNTVRYIIIMYNKYNYVVMDNLKYRVSSGLFCGS
jgi:hypothetical protein